MTPLAERFTGHVSKDADGCWRWIGSLSNIGYGQFRIEGQTCVAHRVAWTLFVGPLPVDREIDHLCRNRACVNPAHMELVDHATNMYRSQARAGLNKRKTHCLRGHELSGDNLRIETQRNGRERRQCRECMRLRARGEAEPAVDPAQPRRVSLERYL